MRNFLERQLGARGSTRGIRLVHNDLIKQMVILNKNDRYSIFGGRREDSPQMDAIEDKYLISPLHHKVKEEHIKMISNLINEGW